MHLIAHIVTVYKQPELALRLIKALQHPGNHIYIHLDKKAEASEYAMLFKQPNVFLINKRINIKWAGYSMVEALLAGIEQILNSGIHYNHINHISGQCFPIKPINTINNFFEQHSTNNFLSCQSLPSGWWEQASTRYESFHFHEFSIKGRYRLELILKKLLPKRKPPFNFTFYGGDHGAYWTITNETAKYLLNFFNENKASRSFFKFSWGPDEFLFNTIIMNSPYNISVINNNYRYIDWSEGGANPKTLTISDFDNLKNSDCFFARKFDLEVDGKILDLMQQII